MTNQHPITPPLELVMQWDAEAALANMPDRVYIATEAARWGADQELEACKKVILDQGWFASPKFRLDQLHNARRPSRCCGSNGAVYS
jgi:hypothetical protein